MNGKLVPVAIGLCIAIASWVPLWIVEAYDRYAMPVGLGLFAFAGSLIGGLIAFVALVRLAIHAFRSSKERAAK